MISPHEARLLFFIGANFLLTTKSLNLPILWKPFVNFAVQN